MDDTTPETLRAFVHRGHLVRLPARWKRKVAALEFIAEKTFQPGRTYSEKEVNDRLASWCEGGEADHITLRRYLVDLRFLVRDNDGCTYWTAG